MKVLITGAFGYIGGRLAQYLAAQTDNEILLGSRQQTESPDWLPQASVVQTKWDSPTSLEKPCTDVDAIVHLAGMNAQDCAADPEAALAVNGVATDHLLQAAVQSGVKRVIYLSTAHVYGSPLAGVITEETCTAATHPYATSHLVGEEAVRSAHLSDKLEGIVIRLSNAFGAPAHKDVNCWMLLVNDLCRQAVTTQKMVLHSSGHQRRDFIALTDTCNAITHLLDIPTNRIGDGLFNVGGEWSPTILEMTERVADRIYAVTGSRPTIQRGQDQITEPADTLDYRIKKLEDTDFRLTNSGSVDQEIDHLVDFCQKHLNTDK